MSALSSQSRSASSQDLILKILLSMNEHCFLDGLNKIKFLKP